MKTVQHVAQGIGAAAVFAVLGTIFHQSIVSGLPLGLMISLASLLVYSISLRPQRGENWAFAISISVLIFLFSQDLGQDKLIPASLLGYIWSYGAIALALLVAMFPRLK